MSSIRTRIATALVVSFVPLLVAAGVLLYTTTKHDLEGRERAILRAKASAVAAAVGFEDGRIEVEPLAGLAAEFSSADRPSYYQVLGADGTVLAQSKSLDGYKLPFSLATMSTGVALVLPDGRAGMAVSEALGPDPELIEEARGQPQLEALLGAGLHVAVADDVLDVEAMLDRLRAQIAYVSGGLLLVGVVLLSLLLRYELKPLESMAGEAQTIDGSNLDRRFETGPLPSELALIRDRMNDLLARLEATIERESRFNSAVAHELRTPIAELRTMTEVALRWPDPEALPRVLRDVLESSVRMQNMVDSLLVLRRVESGHETLETRTVALEPILSNVIAHRASRIRERSITINLECLDGLSIDTESVLFARLTDNWVANAVEYAPLGSIVDVVATVEGASFVLTVSNDAPDLDPSDVEYLFEPFWRKDAARTDPSHSGLGLTITRGIAQVLGCRAIAVIDDQHRLRLSLRGPLART